MGDNYQHSEVTEVVIKGFYNVYNKLGFGFLENVYEKALYFELLKLGLNCKCQCPIEVYYHSQQVGFYVADMIVNSCVIVEIKAASSLAPEHEAQLINYLRATEIEVGILLNFGQIASIKRKVFASAFK